LQGVGCHSIASYANEYRAALPNDTNKTKVSVKKKTLSSRIYRASDNVQGDIISIVMEITHTGFKDSLKKMHDILGLEFTLCYKSPKKKYDPLQIFKKVKNRSYAHNQELKLYDDSILKADSRVYLPHILLINEGIVPSIQEEFDVMYDTESKRILFPHRHWSTGDVVGIFGRTTIKEWEMLNIPKYYGVLPYPKSMNLYGLYQNYKPIQEAGMVVVFEGEKSVLKAKSLGFPIGVALGGHELSTEQIKILIGLDVEIVFALDNDLAESIFVDMCKQFANIRKTSYIYDSAKVLLGDKDAPIDKGLKVFKYLLRYRKQVS
jgi:hypothetical protein